METEFKFCWYSKVSRQPAIDVLLFGSSEVVILGFCLENPSSKLHGTKGY